MTRFTYFVCLERYLLIVSKNIRRLREENKLGMDELSKLSGVSKSMLAQIERGEGNPTISILCKLSNGMKVPFDALTVRPKSPYEIVKISDLQSIIWSRRREVIGGLCNILHCSSSLIFPVVQRAFSLSSQDNQGTQSSLEKSDISRKAI